MRPVFYPRAFERKFSKLTVAMVDAMIKQYENATFKKLNKSTIEKFADCKIYINGEFGIGVKNISEIGFNDKFLGFCDVQIGNWASIFKGLDAPAQRAIRKRFSNQRLNKLVGDILINMNKVNQRAFYSDLESQVGISMQQLIKQEGLAPQMNALILETQEWVNKLRDDVLQEFAASSLHIMATGASYEEVLNNYREEGKKRKNHAEFIARNQISTFNGLSNKLRYQKNGIVRGEWVTAGDERERPAHHDRNGKIFELSEGCYSALDGKHLIPGVDYNCRCATKPILEGD